MDFPNVRHLEGYQNLSANVLFYLSHSALYYGWAGRCVQHGDEARLENHEHRRYMVMLNTPGAPLITSATKTSRVGGIVISPLAFFSAVGVASVEV